MGVFGARAWLESKNKGVEEGGHGEALQNIFPELAMLVSLTSQNVRSFHKDEKQKEFITAMKRRQSYAAALQE